MRFLCSNYVLFLSLCCFSLSSLSVTQTDASVTATPQRKKKVVDNTTVIKQPRQIIEMQETDKNEEFIPIPKRKKSIDEKLRKPRETKNEIKSEKSAESKKNELVVAKIIDSIRNKLTKCWSIPESIAYKENFSIKINLLLSNQGEIIMADVADSSSYKNNPLFRSMADNAMRAAYKCSPITGLPIEHYHIWREVTLDFILNG
ncbi:hypothetical protein HET73_04905 [Wolbachia endosymbiont of Atemnus politus]|uniref:hypothetical protein n=1 Tax=Wolbachia endosymbiont of Atemnus politus TaxID=2682840 RepID=UPI0015740307|nr:hypothetical protein [Wolbachia endosymbiont of Atemnus politus]NSM56745.1 hypothetical protein [Wolbachia endosymbiont of Atemnus politus]NSX83519.1 hypothetical protein [Wolbachia endosymbiont of Atemnus politus]